MKRALAPLAERVQRFRRRKYIKRLKHLDRAVGTALRNVKNRIAKNEKSGIESPRVIFDAQSRLEKRKEEILRYMSLLSGESPLKVGVFGCPSRGKSTLINVLLGLDILPMHSLPGTTKFGTELHHKESGDTDPSYAVTVVYVSGEKVRDTMSWRQGGVKKQLEFLSKNESYVNPKTSEIKVEGPFRSYFANPNIVFVDTPGAIEHGVGKKETNASEPKDDAPENGETTKEDITLESEFKLDTKRALAVLEHASVDIVLFCMRFDLAKQGPKDRDFFNANIKKMDKVINVITYYDKRKGAKEVKTFDDAIRYMQEVPYEITKDDTVAVNAADALRVLTSAQKKTIMKKVARKQFPAKDFKTFLRLEKLLLEDSGTKHSFRMLRKAQREGDAEALKEAKELFDSGDMEEFLRVEKLFLEKAEIKDAIRVLADAPKEVSMDMRKVAREQFNTDDFRGFLRLEEMILEKAGIKDVSAIKARIKKFAVEYNGIKQDVDRAYAK